MRAGQIGNEESVTSVLQIEVALYLEVEEVTLAAIDQPHLPGLAGDLARPYQYTIHDLMAHPAIMVLRLGAHMPAEEEVTGSEVEVEVHSSANATSWPLEVTRGRTLPLEIADETKILIARSAQTVGSLRPVETAISKRATMMSGSETDRPVGKALEVDRSL